MIKTGAAFILILLVCVSCASSVGETASPVSPSPDPEGSPAEISADPPSGVMEKKESEEGKEMAIPEASEFMADSVAELEAPLRRTDDAVSPRSVPAESGLKAGYSDDNRQYGYFLDFLEEYGTVPHKELNVEERIILSVKDRNGVPLPDTGITIQSSPDGTFLGKGVTHADGRYLLFPADVGPDAEEYLITLSYAGVQAELAVQRDGPRSIDAVIPVSKEKGDRIPADVLFVMDTTGSMGEEISRLKNTIELIHLNLQSLPGNIDLRFGMVLYKDAGDEYITSVIPLTADLDEFQQGLNAVYASGGGDHPEDLQSALTDALGAVNWNEKGVRLGYIITDAPPHLDYPDQQSYADSARRALEKGIKFHSVGTGGLDLNGEYILRQIAQYTGGRYIFLTYGESGESEGGAAGSVSHHTGANFTTDKLESIIIRFTKEEISSYINAPLPEPEPYISADRIKDEEKEETLSKLFSMSLEQLLDFSSIALGETISAAILPIRAAQEEAAADAEYFTQQLIFEAGKSKEFTLAERKDIQAIMDEVSFQLSGYTDSEKMTEIGNFLNADFLVLGELFDKGETFELYLRLIRVETGEILSVTKGVIDGTLGL